MRARLALAALLLLGCRHGTGSAADPCAAEFEQVQIEGADAREIGTTLLDADGAYTLHVDLAWPAKLPAEGSLWPLALTVQGTWGPEIASDARVAVADGVAEVRVDLPGSPLTGGTDDRRGDAGRASLASALRWMAGEEVDIGGCTAPQRAGHADPSDLYVVGTSNGGNLAVATLADTTLDLPPVHGLVTWETPISAQVVNVEWGNDPTVYTPGSCAWDVAAGLVCTVDAAPFVEIPNVGQPSVLCYDVDGDGGCTAGTDVLVVGSIDPTTGLRMLSPTLTAAATDAGLALHGYGTTDDATAWWAPRDASRMVGDLVAAQPDLPVLIVGSEEDHVQTTPDHPHIHGWGQALQASGAAWTRLNPGVRWLGAEAEENAPNAPMSLTGDGLRLLTEDEESPLSGTLAAAVQELADRQASGEWTEP